MLRDNNIKGIITDEGIQIGIPLPVTAFIKGEVITSFALPKRFSTYDK